MIKKVTDVWSPYFTDADSLETGRYKQISDLINLIKTSGEVQKEGLWKRKA